MQDKFDLKDFKILLEDVFEAMLPRSYEIYDAVKEINDKFGCDLHVLTYACPLQIEGTINGYAVYFRSRWSKWQLSIAETIEKAIEGTVFNDKPPIFLRSGELDGEFDASWLEARQLFEILQKHFSEFFQALSASAHI